MAISIGDALLKLGVDKGNFDRDMKGIGASIKKHQKAIGIGMVAVGTAIVGMAAASVVSFAKVGDEIAKMAKRTGFSTEALSELRHAADLSGASLAGLEKASRTLAGTILDAGYGLESYTRAFDKIGLSYIELAKLSPEDQLMQVLEALAEVENASERAALATDLFGRAGTQLLPMLADGAEGLANMRQEAHDLGIVFDAEAAKAAEEMTDAMTRVKASLQGAAFAIADSLLPIIKPLIDKVTEAVKAFGAWAKEHEGLTKVIVGAGGLLIALGGLLLILPKITAAWGILSGVIWTTVIPAVWAVVTALWAQVTATLAAMSATGVLIPAAIAAVAAIALLATGITLLVKNQKEQYKATEDVTEATNELTGATETYGDMAEESFEQASEAVEELTEETDKAIDKQRELMGLLGRIYPRGMTMEQMRLMGPLLEKRPIGPLDGFQPGTAGWYKALGFEGFQAGGIITKPTLAMLGEQAPRVKEVVLNEGQLGMFGGYKTANIYVQLDGRALAQAIGEPLVEQIRIRTGVKI